MVNDEQLKYLGPEMPFSPADSAGEEVKDLLNLIAADVWQNRGIIGGHVLGAGLLALAAGGLATEPAQAKGLEQSSSDLSAFFENLMLRMGIEAVVGGVMGGILGGLRQGRRGSVRIKGNAFDFDESSGKECWGNALQGALGGGLGLVTLDAAWHIVAFMNLERVVYLLVGGTAGYGAFRLIGLALDTDDVPPQYKEKGNEFRKSIGR